MFTFSSVSEIHLVLLQLSTAEAVQVARAQHDAYRETYDNLVAEDKVRVLVICSSRCNCKKKK